MRIGANFALSFYAHTNRLQYKIYVTQQNRTELYVSQHFFFKVQTSFSLTRCVKIAVIGVRGWEENSGFHNFHCMGFRVLSSSSKIVLGLRIWATNLYQQILCVQQIYLSFKSLHFRCQTARSKDSPASRLIGCSWAVLVPTPTMLSKPSTFQSTHRFLKSYPALVSSSWKV